MRIDFIDNVNEFGESIVRLYDTDMAESQQLSSILKAWLKQPNTLLDLSMLPFIEAQNCNMIMVTGDEDEGLLTDDYKTFYCKLTSEGFEGIIEMLEPFCEKETLGYQWLYDIDNPIDLLYSPAGTDSQEEEEE
jgi:hypothetical protein